ncbi:hypothetical protein GCM10022268_24030 [Sphingomonas cynarae]|uniref:Tyr recombinase domain-containing protein n=2 Tax=Sphingomonas cynarae TaxID=930197 RepID=A0ABP7E768_9SPHN
MNMMGTIVAETAERGCIEVERRMGEMLWSAVRHGGLLDPTWWHAWSMGVQSSISIEGQILAVDMQPPRTEEKSSTLGRRWFADPLTKILIARWHRDGLIYDGRTPAAECMLLSVGGDEAHDILSGKFLRSARNAWAFRLPGLMLAFAKGEIPSESVPRPTWERALYGCHRPVVDMPSPTVAETKYPKPPLRRSLDGELAALTVRERDYQAGREAKVVRKAAAVLAIKRLPPQHRPLEQCLREWCVYVLEREKRGRHSIGYSPDTVARYLNALILLFAEWTSVAPIEAPVAELETAIIRYLDQTEGRRRVDGVKAVISFLRFRRAVGSAEALDIDLDEYAGEDQTAPDLLLPEDYTRASRALRQQGKADLALMLTLMYRAGLRVAEAAALRVGDVNVSDHHIELVVETNPARSLKTKTSRRILPLDVLLEHDERQLLLDRVRERKAASRFGVEAWLFGRATALSPPAEKNVTKGIGQCLIEIIGSSNIKPGHLRHSFASYLLATLLLPAEVEGAVVPRALRAVISPLRFERVADRLLGHGRLGAGALHAVSQLMGHTGPRTTLRSYCHLLDMSLGILCNRHVSLVPIEEARLLAATGVSAEARRKALSRVRPPFPVIAGDTHVRPTGADVTLWSPHAARKIADARLYASAFSRLSRQLARDLAADVTKAEPRGFQASAQKAVEEKQRKERKRQVVHCDRSYGVPWRAIEAAVMTPALVSTDESSTRMVERWRTSAGRLLPTTIGIVTVLPTSNELRQMIDRRLHLSRNLHRAERVALNQVITRWQRGYADIRLPRLQDAQAFVSLLVGVMGFAMQEVELSLTSVHGHGMTSEDIHRFMIDRTVRPRLAGRSGWRGSLVVRFRPVGVERPILAAQACRMALLILAIDLDARRPLTSTL